MPGSSVGPRPVRIVDERLPVHLLFRRLPSPVHAASLRCPRSSPTFYAPYGWFLEHRLPGTVLPALLLPPPSCRQRTTLFWFGLLLHYCLILQYAAFTACSPAAPYLRAAHHLTYTPADRWLYQQQLHATLPSCLLDGWRRWLRLLPPSFSRHIPHLVNHCRTALPYAYIPNYISYYWTFTAFILLTCRCLGTVLCIPVLPVRLAIFFLPMNRRRPSQDIPAPGQVPRIPPCH